MAELSPQQLLGAIRSLSENGKRSVTIPNGDAPALIAALEIAAGGECDHALIEAALAWRRLHGPATELTSSAMTAVASAAEAVIRERNRAAQVPSRPTVSTPS